jgi:IMP dehydrogenase
VYADELEGRTYELERGLAEPLVVKDVELGMAKTAEKEGLETLDDVKVVDYARHPLVETTKRLQ